MKYLKISLRVWIAISSMIGFLVGWAMLAHAPKPVQPSQQPALVEPAPLLNLDINSTLKPRNRSLQQLPAWPQTGRNVPRLRTGGS
jgi:hypothetical protein